MNSLPKIYLKNYIYIFSIAIDVYLVNTDIYLKMLKNRKYIMYISLTTIDI